MGYNMTFTNLEKKEFYLISSFKLMGQYGVLIEGLFLKSWFLYPSYTAYPYNEFILASRKLMINEV